MIWKLRWRVLQKKAVWDDNKIIYYEVNLTNGNVGDFQDIPTVVKMEVYEYDLETKKEDKSKVIASKTFTQNPPSEIEKLSFNSSSVGTLKKAASDADVSGLQGIFFEKLVEGRANGNYGTIGDIRKTVKALYIDESAFKTAFTNLTLLMTKTTITYD